VKLPGQGKQESIKHSRVDDSGSQNEEFGNHSEDQRNEGEGTSQGSLSHTIPRHPSLAFLQPDLWHGYSRNGRTITPS